MIISLFIWAFGGFKAMRVGDKFYWKFTFACLGLGVLESIIYLNLGLLL